MKEFTADQEVAIDRALGRLKNADHIAPLMEMANKFNPPQGATAFLRHAIGNVITNPTVDRGADDKATASLYLDITTEMDRIHEAQQVSKSHRPGLTTVGSGGRSGF